MLKLNNVFVSYGSIEVLHGIDIHVQKFVFIIRYDHIRIAFSKTCPDIRAEIASGDHIDIQIFGARHKTATAAQTPDPQFDPFFCVENVPGPVCMEPLFPTENISFFVCHKIFSFLLIVENHRALF